VVSVQLRRLTPDDIPPAAALLGVVYRDNPLMLALLGDDPAQRVEIGTEMQLIRLLAMENAVVATRDDALIGVYGQETPDDAPMSADLQQRMGQLVTEAGLAQPFREMLTGFSANTPSGPKWKLGPVGVAAEQQRSGIGSQLVQHFCDQVDAVGSSSSLDTDQPRLVRLYQRFGFEVAAEAPILGVPMWFMARPARKES